MTSAMPGQTFVITSSGLSTGTLHATTTPKPPTDLIQTRVQQTIEGWVGQVLVVGDVVWESDPDEDPNRAVELANDRMIDRISGLFT